MNRRQFITHTVCFGGAYSVATLIPFHSHRKFRLGVQDWYDKNIGPETLDASIDSVRAALAAVLGSSIQIEIVKLPIWSLDGLRSNFYGLANVDAMLMPARSFTANRFDWLSQSMVPSPSKVRAALSTFASPKHREVGTQILGHKDLASLYAGPISIARVRCFWFEPEKHDYRKMTFGIFNGEEEWFKQEGLRGQVAPSAFSYQAMNVSRPIDLLSLLSDQGRHLRTKFPHIRLDTDVQAISRLELVYPRQSGIFTRGLVDELGGLLAHKHSLVPELIQREQKMAQELNIYGEFSLNKLTDGRYVKFRMSQDLSSKDLSRPA